MREEERQICSCPPIIMQQLKIRTRRSPSSIPRILSCNTKGFNCNPTEDGLSPALTRVPFLAEEVSDEVVFDCTVFIAKLGFGCRSKRIH